MSLAKKIKQYLPASSRSLHAMHEDLQALYRRVEQADSGINGNIDFKFDELALPKINGIHDDLLAHMKHDELRFEALFKRAYPNDTPLETRMRIFSLLPEAEGNIRLMQLAAAKLMKKLDEICRQNGIEYWFSYGSLVAALSRHGSIPWDDDIDICMMRDDVRKLADVCESDPEWQVTVAYDWNVLCRQIRFSSTNPDIPVFIDLSPYDWATSFSADDDRVFYQLRIDLMEELRSRAGDFPYWRERGILFAEGSGFVAQAFDIDLESQDASRTACEEREIIAIFEAYRLKAVSMGILAETPTGDESAVAYGIDQIFDAPWRQTLYPRDLFFPVKNCGYEGFQVCVPNQAEEVASICYPGWPYMPRDILGHDHFAKSVLSDESTAEALHRFIEG